MSTLGERAKEVLKIKGLSGSFIATKMNRPRTTVSNYLIDRSYPNEDFFNILIELIPDINLHWLITGKGDMFFPNNKLVELADRTVDERVKVQKLEQQLNEMQAQMKEQQDVLIAFASLVQKPKTVAPTGNANFNIGVHSFSGNGMILSKEKSKRIQLRVHRDLASC